MEKLRKTTKRHPKTLREFYDNLPDRTAPKTEFLNKVAERCRVTPVTVLNWVKYGMKPIRKEHRQILAEVE